MDVKDIMRGSNIYIILVLVEEILENAEHRQREVWGKNKDIKVRSMRE